MFKAYAFDLGNVIVPFDHSSVAHELLRFSCKKGIFSPQDIHNHLYRTTEIEHLYEEGKITTEEFIKNVKETFCLEIPDDKFREIFCNIFFEADQKTTEIIRKIKKSGIRLILISNTNEMHFEYILKRYEIMSSFDEFLLSYRVGVRKPGRKIYEELIETAGCNPADIFYTDDIKEYINAALGLGISAFHFTNSDNLFSYLQKVSSMKVGCQEKIRLLSIIKLE